MTFELNLTVQEMKNAGFRYDMSSELYTYEFPVYKSKEGKVLLWCRLAVEENSQQIRISVYDTNKRLYPAYYNKGRIAGFHSVVSTIDENIKNELKKIILKESKSNDKSRVRNSQKRK